jgi:hypothetical protein
MRLEHLIYPQPTLRQQFSLIFTTLVPHMPSDCNTGHSNMPGRAVEAIAKLRCICPKGSKAAYEIRIVIEYYQSSFEPAVRGISSLTNTHNYQRDRVVVPILVKSSSLQSKASR